MNKGGQALPFPDSSQVYDYAINGNQLMYNFIQDTFSVSPITGDTSRFDTDLLNTFVRN
ncbi:MAG: hypothetical protein AB8F78_14285 [Saprospiraceae bacterium]